MSQPAYVYSYFLRSGGRKGQLCSILTPMRGLRSDLAVQLSYSFTMWSAYDRMGRPVVDRESGWSLKKTSDVSVAETFRDFPTEYVEDLLSLESDPLAAAILTAAWRDHLHEIVEGTKSLVAKDFGRDDLGGVVNQWIQKHSTYLP